jgi:hypothetical protein
VTWTLLQIRDIGEREQAFLYPSPADGLNAVQFEPADGPSASVAATSFSLSSTTPGGRSSELISVAGISMAIHVTDARVIVACSRYDKGGGWRGAGLGAVFAVGANVVSMARAANRRHGTSLVGHVRFPWLQSVAYRAKTGVMSSERIVLSAEAMNSRGETTLFDLDLSLPKTVSAEKVAHGIASRAARVRLAAEPVAPEIASVLCAVIDEARTTEGKYSSRVFQLPGCRPVREDDS